MNIHNRYDKQFTKKLYELDKDIFKVILGEVSIATGCFDGVVEVIVEKEVPVETIVEVPVEKVVKEEVLVEVPVEKIIEKPIGLSDKEVEGLLLQQKVEIYEKLIFGKEGD